MALRTIAPFEIKRRSLSAARPPPKSLQQILSGAIPSSLLGDLPKSYDLVGDIIIIEDLPESLSSYGEIIGSAFLDIYPKSRTCLLKTGKVEGERRVPAYMLLAGEDKTQTIYSEHGLRLHIDLGKAYFSPRLAYERQRVAAMVKKGETVVDMFAGVGPFSLAIAKKTAATVHAIDINPDAIILLLKNISTNRLKGEVHPILGDAALVSKSLAGVADHVIMNLPGSSLGFLDSAVRLLKPSGGSIHIYFFSNDPDPGAAASQIKAASNVLCSRVKLEGMRVVKEVAPRKWQYVADIRCRPRGRPANAAASLQR